MVKKNYFQDVKNLFIALLILFIASFNFVTNVYASDFSMTLLIGKSYEFQNVSSSSAKLVTKNGRSDYVVYKSDGTIYSQNSNAGGDITVPAGNKVIVTSVGDTLLSITGADTSFVKKESATPAMRRQVFEVGDTYEITNVSKESVTINEYGGGRVDYVVYNPDGTINGQVANKSLTSSIYHTITSVPASKKLVITAVEAGVKIAIPYNKFTLVKVTNPAMLRQTLEVGETAVFTNASNEKVLVDEYGSGRVDGVVYNPDGTINSQWANRALTSSISNDVATVPAGGKLVITVVEPGVKLAAPYTKFTKSMSSTPAILRQVLEVGETAVFTNASNEKVLVDEYGSGRVDGVVYNPDGTINSQWANRALTSSISNDVATVPAGGKLVIMSVEPGVRLAAPYTHFTKSMLSTPVMLRQTLSTGETGVFTNKSNEMVSVIEYGGSSGRADYVSYRLDGSVYNQGTNADIGTVNVPAGGKLVVKCVSTSMVKLAASYSHFVLSKSSIMMDSGETYLFTGGVGGGTIDFDYDYYKHNVDYVLVTKNNTYEDKVVFDTMAHMSGGFFYIGENERFIVTLRSSNSSVVNVSENMRASKTSTLALNMPNVRIGEKVTFTNSSNIDRSIISGPGVGSVSYKHYYKNSNSTINHGTINLPISTIKTSPGDIVELTVLTAEGGYANIGGANEAFGNGVVIVDPNVIPGNNDTTQVSILVQIGGLPVVGASVIMGTEEKFTDSNGVATFTVNKDSTTNYYVSMKNYGTRHGTVKANQSSVNANVVLPAFKYGDINGDGNTTITDVSLSYQKLRGKTVVSEHTVKVMDVNKDGKVSITDISLIYSRSRGKIPSFN